MPQTRVVLDHPVGIAGQLPVEVGLFVQVEPHPAVAGQHRQALSCAFLVQSGLRHQRGDLDAGLERQAGRDQCGIVDGGGGGQFRQQRSFARETPIVLGGEGERQPPVGQRELPH